MVQRVGHKRIILTGMGSSMIFPAKQAKNRAMKLGLNNKVEAYFASDLFQYSDFSDTVLFLSSNSGESKEIILFLEHALKHGGECIAITAVADSTLAQRCSSKIVLRCGFEQGVAATKSVVEQALINDSLIFNLAKAQGLEVNFEYLQAELLKTAKSIADNVNLEFPPDLIQAVAKSQQLFFIGLENGVAEEIALKASEISRKLAIYYPDTQIVHGVQEVIDGGTTILCAYQELLSYLADFEKFSQQTNTQLIVLGADTGSPFGNYSLLASGWGFLCSLANSLKIDIDHPLKAQKVGNSYQ